MGVSRVEAQANHSEMTRALWIEWPPKIPIKNISTGNTCVGHEEAAPDSLGWMEVIADDFLGQYSQGTLV